MRSNIHVATAGDTWPWPMATEREREEKRGEVCCICNAAAKRNCRNRYEKTTIALCDLVSNKVRFLSMWYDAVQGRIIPLTIT